MKKVYGIDRGYYYTMKVFKAWCEIFEKLYFCNIHAPRNSLLIFAKKEYLTRGKFFRANANFKKVKEKLF